MYIIYYIDPAIDHPFFVKSEGLVEALNLIKSLRGMGYLAVTMTALENPDQVGVVGVNSVENGKLPDGTDYDWKKEYRKR